MGRVEAALARLWWRESRTAIAWLLWPLSGLYRAVTSLRRLAYALGWLRTETAPVPVIVVGNLVAGGAGKTPTVIALVHARPDITTGVLLEHFAERDEAAALQKLAMQDLPGDEDSWRQEMLDAAVQLEKQMLQQRLDELQAKQRSMGLDETDKYELRTLLQARIGRH